MKIGAKIRQGAGIIKESLGDALREEEILPLEKRVRIALSSKQVRKAALEDFSYTFVQIGMERLGAQRLAGAIIGRMVNYVDSHYDRQQAILNDRAVISTPYDPFYLDRKAAARFLRRITSTEDEVASLLEAARINGRPLVEALRKKLSDRKYKVAEQIGPFLAGTSGKILDYGAGSGMNAQHLHDALNLDVEAVDIRDFKSPSVGIKYRTWNNKRIPVDDNYYECSFATNVLHHEVNNFRIIRELTRVTKSKIVLIETVPESESIEDYCRTFLNDVLWNRFFNRAEIPVPGRYESAEGWIKRFGDKGWKCTRSEALGYDQPTIRDLHHLLVFER
ncbi:MAG: class I SAM-dependent methyltransferase [Candidatus Micrarchaeota archaeon]|nr:class I SAM-dependent methyltransferase [Candidatus Micrarchaeota archaeon]